MLCYARLLEEGKRRLEQAGIKEAGLDAWYLLSEAFSLSRERYLLDRNQPVHPAKEALKQYENWIMMRSERVPLQHILGTQEFMGISFDVNPDVLIPRQDTETLVEEVLERERGGTVLDICTGSGCIAVSLACLGCFSGIDASDISEKALAVAKENAKKQKVAIGFYQSNLFENISDTYDILVSNPPYIPKQIIENLEPEVRQHEPYLALYGAENGLYFYRRISREGKKHLNFGGRIYYEIGHDQAEAVSCILRENGYGDIAVKKDLAGHDRVVRAVKNK